MIDITRDSSRGEAKCEVLTYSVSRKTLYNNTGEIHLTYREGELLELLSKFNAPIDRVVLNGLFAGRKGTKGMRNADMHIAKLNKKIPQLIKNRPGVGYYINKKLEVKS